MKRRSKVFGLVAAMLAGALWLPTASSGATVPAGFVLAQHVDWRVRMEREAAGYVRAGYRALKQGQLQKARAWFLKAKKLFPDHKGANAGLRQVKAAEDQAEKRAAEARRKILYYTNSIGMKFRLIPAGSFMMGSPPGERKRDIDEDQHRVVISRPFYLQTTEVTQAQYRKVIGKNPSAFKNCDRCPVERVSWHDAQEFIRRLNAREKTNKYRLPTEAEWEYACRAGSTTPFYFGQTISTDQANYNGHEVYGGGRKGVYRRKTTPAGSFPPNRWGLYDMHGNVYEWCSDWYGYDYYRRSPTRDPWDRSSDTFRVLRGGSWDNNPGFLRSADRLGSLPSNNYRYYGFRVLRKF